MRLSFLIAACVLFIGCSEPELSPEDGVRAWLASAELAVEAEDRNTLLEKIAPGYSDGRGNDRKRLGDLLRVYFLRQDAIALLVNIDKITLSGETAATVLINVGIAGSGNNALGFNADLYNFELELHKPDDEWLLLGASWAEFGGRMH